MIMKGMHRLVEGKVSKSFEEGIICNYWLDMSLLPQDEVATRPTEKELNQHLRQYN